MKLNEPTKLVLKFIKQHKTATISNEDLIKIINKTYKPTKKLYERAIQRATARLSELGMIEKTENHNEKGKQLTNTLTFISDTPAKLSPSESEKLSPLKSLKLTSKSKQVKRLKQERARVVARLDSNSIESQIPASEKDNSEKKKITQFPKKMNVEEWDALPASIYHAFKANILTEEQIVILKLRLQETAKIKLNDITEIGWKKVFIAVHQQRKRIRALIAYITTMATNVWKTENRELVQLAKIADRNIKKMRNQLSPLVDEYLSTQKSRTGTWQRETVDEFVFDQLRRNAILANQRALDAQLESAWALAPGEVCSNPFNQTG